MFHDVVFAIFNLFTDHSRSNICLTLTIRLCKSKRSWTPTRIQRYQTYLSRLASDERPTRRRWRASFLDGSRVISTIRTLLPASSSHRRFSRMEKCSALSFIGECFFFRVRESKFHSSLTLMYFHLSFHLDTDQSLSIGQAFKTAAVRRRTRLPSRSSSRSSRFSASCRRPSR